MSGDWRRLHQVRGVCGGSPENHRVTRLSHKAEAEDRAWLLGQNRSVYQQSCRVCFHCMCLVAVG
jgi:hypothetical protein